MTTKPLDAEDPMALVGVQLEEGPDDRAFMEMAWCLAEEYAPPPGFFDICLHGGRRASAPLRPGSGCQGTPSGETRRQGSALPDRHAARLCRESR